MGQIGANRRNLQLKCIVCEKTFLEDELELKPYDKTKTLELMCQTCIPANKASTLDDVRINTKKQKDKNKIKTKKKSNKIKDIVNEEAEPVKPTTTCSCAKFPLCKAMRATQAWDEFSNKEIRAYFVGAGFDFYKIDFCPFCGQSLYKK